MAAGAAIREFLHGAIAVADPEVVDPAGDVAAQLVDDFLHLVTTVTAGDLIRFAHPCGAACGSLSALRFG